MKHPTIEYDPITGAKQTYVEVPETIVEEQNLARKATDAQHMTTQVRNARDRYLRSLSNTKKK